MRARGCRNRLGEAVALFFVATVALSVAGRSEPQPTPTPLQLFQRMMPAIRHPRCTNCHGVVDPRSGKNHHGGAIPPDSNCLECHTDAEEWQIPGNEHFFAGRSDREICSQVSDFVSTFGREPFRMKHIRKDDQILQAFEGFAGGAREVGKTYPDGTIGPKGEKPPMTHQAFVAAGDDWILRGNGACDLEGTITYEEWVSSVDTVQNTPEHTHITTQTGTRTATVTVQGSRATADITASGKITSVSTQTRSGPKGKCTVVTTINKTYSGTTNNGLATVLMKDTAFMIPRPKPPQADYRIDVELPKEKTLTSSSIEIKDGCGTGLTALPAETTPNEYDEWSFTLEGRVQNTKENAIGGCTKTVRENEVGITQPMSIAPCNRWGHMGNAVEPWLMNHGADGSYHNGSPIPFHINVTWNLRRR